METALFHNFTLWLLLLVFSLHFRSLIGVFCQRVSFCFPLTLKELLLNPSGKTNQTEQSIPRPPSVKWSIPQTRVYGRLSVRVGEKEELVDAGGKSMRSAESPTGPAPSRRHRSCLMTSRTLWLQHYIDKVGRFHIHKSKRNNCLKDFMADFHLYIDSL